MHQVYFWQVFGRSRTPLGILRRSPAPWSAGDGLHPPIRQRTGRIRRLVLGAYGASPFAPSTDDVSTRARLAMSRRASRNRRAAGFAFPQLFLSPRLRLSAFCLSASVEGFIEVAVRTAEVLELHFSVIGMTNGEL